MINDTSKAQTNAKTNSNTTKAPTMAVPDLQQEPHYHSNDTKATTMALSMVVVQQQQHHHLHSGYEGVGGEEKRQYSDQNQRSVSLATNKTDDRVCKQTSTTTKINDELSILSPTTQLLYSTSGSSTHVSATTKTTEDCLEADERKPSTTTKMLECSSMPMASLPSSLSPSSRLLSSVINTTTMPMSSTALTVLQNKTTTLTHKNITNVPSEASYHRTVETETSTVNSRKADQCELLELNIDKKFFNHTNNPKQDHKQTEVNTTCQIRSLAEHKALLKREFFKDFPSSPSVTDYSSSPSGILPTTASKIQSITPLSKRLLKKHHNLKLKIPSLKVNKNLVSQGQTTSETISAATSETLTPNFSSRPKQPSLVALRKLDLQRKLVRINCSAFPRPDTETITKIFPAPQFPSVKELARRFDQNPSKMIVPQTKINGTELDMASLKPDVLDQRNSPLSDEGCNLGQSPYSSDDDDNDSIRTTHTAIERLPAKRKDKVARSASSDSALGLDVDESMDTTEGQGPLTQQKRRMTLTVTDLPLRPALLPLAEPTLLPDSPPVDILTNINVGQTQIPSKVLLEERVVEIPEDPRSGGSSRRESSQSCVSDYPSGDMQGVRFVRTPSVVVSDYSDDIMCGITLEEIEYFRAQRMRRRRSSLETSGTEKDALDNNSDVSAASSCSNLYYCGSTISALDGAECLVNGMRMQLERKTSDCSTCSVSGDEESTSHSFTIPEQPEDCQDLSDMLANQHLSCKRSKKVGGISTGLLTVDNVKLP
ncbi:uncharacterized protein LOC142229474 [Haematobia irritans]|uniref:uncharacterized protein LOC142229474 n=1 Tax=Haematobia irritans TaxID=7368 RepID=UPI003F4F87F1